MKGLHKSTFVIAKRIDHDQAFVVIETHWTSDGFRSRVVGWYRSADDAEADIAKREARQNDAP
jgi:hypothetical protein